MNPTRPKAADRLPSEWGPRLFFGLAAITLAFRAWFAWTLPITGDEAYFFYWGVFPELGFYDHPPMVGWWLAALSQLSSQAFTAQPFLLRLPSLLLPLVLAAVAFGVLRAHGRRLAWVAASLLLLLPLNAWNVAITTDIPLIFFAALSLAAYVAARRSNHPVYYILCGLALGGALLSKYFAGLFALALAAHMVFGPKPSADSGRPWLGLLLVILFSLPAALIQIYWNSLNCWPNLMFNLVNRHGNSGWSWKTPLLYLATVAYVMTPPVVVSLLPGLFRRNRASQADSTKGSGGELTRAELTSAELPEWVSPRRPVSGRTRAATLNPKFDRSIYAWLSLFGFVAFLALSAVKTIGLHWPAIFILPALLWFACQASRGQLRFTLQFAVGFALSHYLLIAAILLAPVETFSRWRGYSGLVMTLAPDDLGRALEPYRTHKGKSLRLASDGYSGAVTMGFNLGEYMLVFGPGSSHARHDDILSDMRKLKDANGVLIVRRDRTGNADDARYFDRIQTFEIQVRGATFYLTQGFGFKYEAYRDEVLDQVRQRYYAVPSWLPKGPCYFCDRYFPERSCHRSIVSN